MDESFTLDDLDRSDILQAAEQPFVDTITTCSCRGMCLRERGRNACPCKNIGQFCSSACHANGSRCRCLNKRAVQEDHSSSSSSESADDSDFSGDDEVPIQPRGRAGQRRGRGGPRRGRSGTRRCRAGRVQRRGEQRRQERGAGRGYGRLIPEANVQERQAQHEQQMQVSENSYFNEHPYHFI